MKTIQIILAIALVIIVFFLARLLVLKIVDRVEKNYNLDYQKEMEDRNG